MQCLVLVWYGMVWYVLIRVTTVGLDRGRVRGWSSARGREPLGATTTTGISYVDPKQLYRIGHKDLCM